MAHHADQSIQAAKTEAPAGRAQPGNPDKSKHKHQTYCREADEEDKQKKYSEQCV